MHPDLRKWLTTLTLALFLPQLAQGDTVLAQRTKASLRLIQLKKLTVGPDDQYHGAVDPSLSTLVFTRKSDLVPHLCTQNLKTGEVNDLLPLTADSEEPALNPKGEVAFNYFKFKASGDICYKSTTQFSEDEAQVKCLSSGEGETSNPFWLGTEKLGYLLRDTWTRNNRIYLEDLTTHEKKTLADGRIWSPAIDPDGKYLFYNELIAGKSDAYRVLVMRNLETSKTKILKFALPGISGFPAVSPDMGRGKYLYFSHYLNDTNNDNVIDGKDNSVIFRVPLKDLENQKEIVPEQLTSVENNCSYPRPQKDRLFVTCAFEGALDIYELPVTGVVPVEWTEAILNNAHQTSRSYSDRLLILNTLKYRFPKLASQDLDLRILSDHILSDDMAASKFSLEKLETKGDASKSDFYRMLNHFLDGVTLKKVHKSDEVTPEYLRSMNEVEKQINEVHKYPRFKTILHGLLKSYLNQTEQAYSDLKKVQFNPPVEPLERYYYFELASWVLPRMKPSKADLTHSLINVYREMMKAPEFSEETQIYYAFHFLQNLQDLQFSIPERISWIQKAEGQLPKPVSDLLQSEVYALQLVLAPTPAAKMKSYHDLETFMSSSRDDYFLRKALYIRAILNFQQAAEFDFINYVASNWLRFTQDQDTEYANAKDVFSSTELDQAYDNIGKKTERFSADYFYGSLSFTDDLESHIGYIKAMVARGDREVLNTRYKNLRTMKFVDDNLKFVEAMFTLIDAHPTSERDVSAYQQALNKLEAMSQDRDSPVRYLLMGYCYLEIVLRTGSGYEFDHDAFEKSHMNLMLAYDQARDNIRVEASTLMDLGLLHQRVQNHGLAVKFFAKRKTFGFVSADEEARFTWFYSRSLFFNHQEEAAAQQLGKILERSPPAMFQEPFQNRRAFYLMTAGKFNEAAQAYEKLLRGRKVNFKMNLARAQLSYGYCLFKLKKVDDAIPVLKTAAEEASHLAVIPKGNDRWLQFDPKRIQLVAFGLLGQMGTSVQKLDALEKRRALLQGAQGMLDQWMPDIILNDLQLARIYIADSNSNSSAKAVASMKDAITYAEKFGDVNQYLSHSIYVTAVDYLVHASLHPDLYASESSEQIRNVVDRSVKAYEEQKTAQPLLDYQKLMLQILWSAYSTRVLKIDDHENFVALTQSDAYAGLKGTLPDRWKELNQVVAALK